MARRSGVARRAMAKRRERGLYGLGNARKELALMLNCGQRFRACIGG